MLALIYTGGILGPDLAIARLVLSLVFGISIGMLMAAIFWRDDQAHDEQTDLLFAGQGRMQPAALAFLLLLIALLLCGTLKVALLTTTYWTVTIPWGGVDQLQSQLAQLIPFDPRRGGEGLSAQGALLILLLGLVGLASWRGIETIFEGWNRWTTVSLLLLGITLVMAAVGVQPNAHNVELLINGRALGVLTAFILLAWLLKYHLPEEQQCNFLWESWKFVKQIFPLLIIGVFLVGILRELIKPEWIEAVAGNNTLSGNLAGVTFGVFMYFPTLVEVPIAQMFLSLGMHRGPLLAYLMADPELSLQSILITAAIIGHLKTWTYVAWVALFSTLAGLLYGFWIDGLLWLG